MRYVYENFTEIAEDFRNGEHLTHVLSGHSTEECFTWQEAIMQFAGWLDKAKIELPKDEEVYERLWKEAMDGVKKWVKEESKND